MKFKLSSRSSLQAMEIEEVILRQALLDIETMGNKVASKWHGSGVIIGRLVNKFSLLYYRRNTIDTDLNDLRPANKILIFYVTTGPCVYIRQIQNSMCVI